MKITTLRVADRPHTPFFNITQNRRGTRSPSVFFIAVILLAAIGLNGASSKEDASLFLGYQDKNRDGVNDIYFDADGNGINDVDGKPVFAGVEFIDEDKDGVNDIYCDADGDGVNDRYAYSKKVPVMDMNGDGINDITGRKYKKGMYYGYQYGKCFEEKGVTVEDFTDENGDMMDDEIREMIEKGGSDRFVDENGDGICDGREQKIERMKENQNSRGKENETQNKKGSKRG